LLGFTECRVYHNALLESNSQSKIYSLRKLHTLDMKEDDKEKSLECTKVLKYSEEKGVDGNTSYNCLIEWNGMSKSQSWVNFFALSLSNPIPFISFASKNQYLDKIPFCHLIVQYCKSKPSTIIAKAQKSSGDTTGIKYKFGIQVLKGKIMNTMSLDRKNRKNLWEEAIKTKSKQLTD
jgi:hypothetical protein